MSGVGERSWDQRLEEVRVRVEADLHRLVAYLNDEVVPDVRRSGSSALRAAATELQRLAEQMDDRSAPSGARTSSEERKRP